MPHDVQGAFNGLATAVGRIGAGQPPGAAGDLPGLGRVREVRPAPFRGTRVPAIGERGRAPGRAPARVRAGPARPGADRPVPDRSGGLRTTGLAVI
ncbi:hypothetical protein GCM10009660_11220 [Catellatospora bangladeshensis]